MVADKPEPYAAGTIVRLLARSEVTGAVISADHVGGELRYVVFHGGAAHQYLAAQIEAISAPTRLRAVSGNELHAALTSVLVLDPDSDYLHSRNAGRVDFEPYQYRPVLKLVQADRPRILIADDVGVGKTIEACLIIKELEARKRADSVLVICPRPLVVDEKWRNELKRFDEDFVHLDSRTLRWCLEETAREGAWPSRYRKAILPYSLLDESLLTGQRNGKKSHTASLDDLAGELSFDLVIVDEAHHIRNRETKAYQCVQRFVDAADAAVMLSATPIQTHNQDLFTLVNLLRDDLVLDRDDFQVMLEPNEHLYNASQEARSASPSWPTGARAHVERALRTRWGMDVLAVDPRTKELLDLLSSSDPDKRTRVRAVRLIEALNTFSEIVTRTRRRDIGDFTTRKPSAPVIDFTETQADVYGAVLALGERIAATRAPEIPVKFLMSTLYRQAASSISGLAPLIEDLFENRLRGSEMVGEDEEFILNPDQIADFRAEVRAIQDRALTLIGAPDPKADLLRQIIEDKSSDTNNKVLIFSTFRHTLAYLEENCRRWGLRVGIMHGGVPDDDRRTIRRRFKLDRSSPDALDVMLCSEVGTEGLDYQFCNTLVNYDIPWNPMRIEQRIGRIDRRGQKSETVAIINLVTRGTIEAEIYDRCLVRIGVFNHAIGGSEQILGELTASIVDIATDLQLNTAERAAALRQLADNKIARIEEEQRLEDQQSDLLGYSGHSFEAAVAEASSEWLSEGKLAGLARQYFERLQPGRSIALRPGRVAQIPLRPDAAGQIATDLEDCRIDSHRLKRMLRRDRVVFHLTTDPELAEDDNEIELLGPAHPLVHLAAMQSAIAEPVAATMRVASDRIVPGIYPMAVYAWTRLGSRDALTLRIVADAEALEEHGAGLLSTSVGSDHRSISDLESRRLDERHAALWVAARDEHRDQQVASAERRLAALRSQKARRLSAIKRQLDSASHSDIKAMKLGEFRGAEVAFDRLLAAHEQAMNRADLTTRHLANVLLEVVAP
ncbi:helicase-related protein [Agromyces laixinhei]|uniref:helicase-related protein n=1 Tax=Agromyces laixinhei TaxID=2585717 RepID=UPI0018DD88A4|nr:helicase-related protein [Agromyces laixinhei]